MIDIRDYDMLILKQQALNMKKNTDTIHGYQGYTSGWLK
jgi:hypothetical protein